MDGESAEARIRSLRSEDGATWRDPKHIATTTFRLGVIEKLSRESKRDGYAGCALAEFRLSEILPEICCFMGIFEVDNVGIWYWDGDGSIDEAVWRQRVIPWRYVRGVVLHQAS